MSQPQQFVSIQAMGRNADLSLPEITVVFIGPKGGTRAVETVSPENARKLAASLIEAADKIEGGAQVLPPMPPTKDREADSLGYLESDRDWAASNNDAVEWLADNHVAIRTRLSEGKS